MKSRRKKFSDELKLEIIKKYLSTDMSIQELREEYCIGGGSTIHRWMQKMQITEPEYKKIEAMKSVKKEINNPKESEQEKRIKELEEQLSKEQMKTDFLNTMIDIAERELKINIRKK